MGEISAKYETPSGPWLEANLKIKVTMAGLTYILRDEWRLGIMGITFCYFPSSLQGRVILSHPLRLGLRLRLLRLKAKL